MDLKGKKINFLGDSITQGDGTSAEQYCFVSRIAAKYGAVCRNYGVFGTRIARQTKPFHEPIFDRDYCGRAEEMDPDADLIVVFGGTNDFGHGDAPLGCMSDRTVYTFYGALHYLIHLLKEKYPQATIVFLTPLHRVNEDNPRGDLKETDVATLSEYVQIIREVAAFYSLPVLDLFEKSALQASDQERFDRCVPGGLHPNDEGHQILAEEIGTFLENL